MTKTKFSVEIHGSGSFNEALIQIITHHNEGKVRVDIPLLMAYVQATYARWPISSQEAGLKHNIGQGVLEVSENDKPTLTITERSIHELEEPIPTMETNKIENN